LESRVNKNIFVEQRKARNAQYFSGDARHLSPEQREQFKRQMDVLKQQLDSYSNAKYSPTKDIQHYLDNEIKTTEKNQDF
jgi:hypothetical protein